MTKSERRGGERDGRGRKGQGNSLKRTGKKGKGAWEEYIHPKGCGHGDGGKNRQIAIKGPAQVRSRIKKWLPILE